MNHGTEATVNYISRAIKFWLEEFKVDGYRLDLSKGFTQNNTLGDPDAMAQYDQSRIDILKRYAEIGKPIGEISIPSADPSSWRMLYHCDGSKSNGRRTPILRAAVSLKASPPEEKPRSVGSTCKQNAAQ